MNITILSVTDNKVPTKKPGQFYNQLEVAYKDNSSGKVAGKKVMSFGAGQPAYKVLRTAQPNDVFEITNRQDGEYWNWVEAVPASADAAPVASTSKTTVSPKSTYETAEERAKRQVLIVRQSSLSNAVAFTEGSKSKTVEDVLSLAQTFTDFVFEEAAPTQQSSLMDIPDDIPY